MKLAPSTLALLFALTPLSAVAEESGEGDTPPTADPKAIAGEKPRANLGIALNQDNFFGFYATFNGTYRVLEPLDFSFYGILWTIPAFGAGGGGSNLWTEFGVGARYRMFDDRLAIKPQVGITNGSLLSSGARGGVAGASTGPNFLDGVVPSLTLNYGDDRFEAEGYVGYYIAARRPEGNVTLDFLHFWGNAGVKFLDIFAVGAHYEQLRNTRNSGTGQAADNYQWLGGYLQVSLPLGAVARFTGGANVLPDAVGDFYKLSLGVNF